VESNEAELFHKGILGPGVFVLFSLFNFSVGIAGKLYSEYVLDGVGFVRHLIYDIVPSISAEFPSYGLPIRIEEKPDYSSILDVLLHRINAKRKKDFTESAEKI